MTDAPHFTSANCPLCGGAGRVLLHRLGRDLRRCTACRFAWIPQGVARTPGNRSIYEDETSLFMTEEQRDYYRDASTIDAARDKVAWVRRDSPDGAALLDVGANFGYFVKEASRYYAAVGIEPSPAVVQCARKEIGAAVERGSIDEDRPDFHGRFDVITMFDVIEHVGDPRLALRRCREYLRPNGRLYISTPDAGSAIARLLGTQWYYIDMIEHVALFDRTNLRRLLYETGFRTLATRTIGRRYRFSYIERRLGQLAAGPGLLHAAHLLSLPLRHWPDARVTLRLGDVMGLVATPK